LPILQEIVFRVKESCKHGFQLLKSIGIQIIKFFNGPAITAFATAVIAIYAFFTFGVQKQLMKLQANFIAMETEPRLTGGIGYFAAVDEPKNLYHYRLTNIGSDTAWSVFPKMRAIILCDTMVIYPRTYLFGLMYSSGVFRGNFSHFNPIAPAETKKFGFDPVDKHFIKLSNMLGGIILLEVNLVYWGDSPTKKYMEEEYFIYNKQMSFQDEYFEKLTRPRDRLLCQLDSLKDARKIADIHFRLHSMLILSNPVPSPDTNDFPWTYRDTFIVLDSTIEKFPDYRRKFIDQNPCGFDFLYFFLATCNLQLATLFIQLFVGKHWRGL
jgi:hypothetical protein